MNPSRSEESFFISDIPLHPFEHLDPRASDFCVKADIMCWEIENGQAQLSKGQYLGIRYSRKVIYEVLTTIDRQKTQPEYIWPDGSHKRKHERDALMGLQKRIEKLYQKYSHQFITEENGHSIHGKKNTKMVPDTIAEYARTVEVKKAQQQDGTDTLPTNILAADIIRQAPIKGNIAEEMSQARTTHKQSNKTADDMYSTPRILPTNQDSSKRKGTLVNFLDRVFRKKN
ncbi:MAG: hypothetical protein P1V18_01725 [Candidatus Gracilibacteria bacterium]|nr:hypothetical protein [Candidatus Gracilibacteria bacterium]